jgi:hypothetical protein
VVLKAASDFRLLESLRVHTWGRPRKVIEVHEPGQTTAVEGSEASQLLDRALRDLLTACRLGDDAESPILMPGRAHPRTSVPWNQLILTPEDCPGGRSGHRSESADFDTGRPPWRSIRLRQRLIWLRECLSSPCSGFDHYLISSTLSPLARKRVGASGRRRAPRVHWPPALPRLDFLPGSTYTYLHFLPAPSREAPDLCCRVHPQFRPKPWHREPDVGDIWMLPFATVGVMVDFASIKSWEGSGINRDRWRLGVQPAAPMIPTAAADKPIG